MVTRSGTVLSLSEGWSWIGYLPNDSLAINEALSSLSYGTYIKNQSEFSDFIDLGDDDQFWFGTLNLAN